MDISEHRIAEGVGGARVRAAGGGGGGGYVLVATYSISEFNFRPIREKQSSAGFSFSRK